MTVKVKPLEWEDFFYARGAIAQAWNDANYLIVKSGDSRYEINARYPDYTMGIQGMECFHPTLESAKAAAQADYEALILSAIDTTDLEAHIGAVLEQAAVVAEREGGWRDHHMAHHISRAIRALRPDAMQALERVRREARVEGMRAALAIADQMERQNGPLSKRGFPEQYRKGLEAAGNAIANAIRALIEAERGKP